MNKKTLFLILLAFILFIPFFGYAQTATVCTSISRVKTVIYQVGGTLVIVGWVIAGILYLTAMGSPEKTVTAKKAMFAALIGTVLIIIAGAASSIVMDALNFTTGAVPLCP